ncbi:MAG: diphthine--ammonia ligase [Methanosarcinaceae archaeon]|jgi:asparagine synthase (glutamine-hydrolysing)|nr:diphthine--ammonia ligase [Methanosarcinaceae archaeon]
MCGIIGFFNIKDAAMHTLKAIKILKNRGKDGFGICNKTHASYSTSIDALKPFNETCIFGHTLHAMVNYVPQPIFYKEAKIVANCEIYNWKELDNKYNLNAKNDADFLIKFIHYTQAYKKNFEPFNEIVGVYAFAYWVDSNVYLVRDIIGVKPIWYSTTQGFAFASEKKALNEKIFLDIRELNPREIICYNINLDKIYIKTRDFFSIEPELKESINAISKELELLLKNAIKLRIPNEPFGILFSGGLDSTILAYLCMKMGIEFTCYTVGLKGTNAPDIIHAKKQAKLYGFPIKIKEIDLDEVEKQLKIIVPILEDATVPKVGVAIMLHVACLKVKEDGIRVILTGTGADEIFAGYDRHKRSSNIKKDCYSDVLQIYEKNTYRDDVISMYNNIEIRVPYLDTNLINYSLKIPSNYLIDESQNKIILRKVGENIGLLKEFTERKKQAAQYGSRFDKAITKLTKRQGFKTKTEYLKTFYKTPTLKLGVLFSSGKDSNYAMYIMKNQNHSIECLITIESHNPHSYMLHTPNINLASLQAEALDIPLIIGTTQGEKEIELLDIKNAIAKAKAQFNLEGIVTGAIHSNYQRERIEKICDELGLKVFSPLWNMNQYKEMKELLSLGFEFIFSSIAADGLNSSWVGRIIENEDVEKLLKLELTKGINIAGEGGEFESFVLDMPMYKKKIEIIDFEIVEKGECEAECIIKNAKLVEKNKTSL